MISQDVSVKDFMLVSITINYGYFQDAIIDYDSTFQITPDKHLSCHLIKIFSYPLCSCMNRAKLTMAVNKHGKQFKAKMLEAILEYNGHA